MDTFLAYWAEDGDDSLDTFETEQEAVDCLEEWIERRRDDAADEGWPLGMRGYVARLTHRVQEYETKAPEGSSFETCCDYAVKSLPDDQAARIAALEGEVAALRAQLAAPPTVDRDALRDAIADALGDAYDCTRVWSAWGYGTMSQDDFRPVADDEDRLMEIVDAVVVALAARQPYGVGVKK